jgi:hypothetical protein
MGVLGSCQRQPVQHGASCDELTLLSQGQPCRLRRLHQRVPRLAGAIPSARATSKPALPEQIRFDPREAPRSRAISRSTQNLRRRGGCRPQHLDFTGPVERAPSSPALDYDLPINCAKAPSASSGSTPGIGPAMP